MDLGCAWLENAGVAVAVAGSSMRMAVLRFLLADAVFVVWPD